MHFHEKPNTYVTNVELKVSDLQRSLTYYQDVIGFKVLHQESHKATLTADGRTALLTIVQPETVEEKQRMTTGLYHFALLLPTRRDLANIITHFHEKGVYLGASDHAVSEALYLNDPDHNGIEVYVDRPESEWTWYVDQVHMVTEPLNIQSILEEGNGNWSGLPEGTVMGHIHLSVSNLAETEQFYTNGLGYDIVSRYGTQALFISTGRYHHHIGLNTWHSENAPKLGENQVGLKTFSLRLDNEEQASSMKANLRAMGAPVIDIDGGFQTEDPSGNVVLLKF
ncbi:VOC family protein [Lysinibacillus irui]|uniref:VOC family protein n=1 Tax=Lysinibacillus irui TaxID=2998077 RepID=A0ABU5NJA1_9BACI|nr:VOC family protein [Lysinibacillus irui]MEA0553720.1 VOC family protein [Lysinibacillus irui]MEA0976104.1 VOC family protein [Lysinibacillus irui]MEA1042258.1 VOC family protein [Lysinibacillus irui]